jgi:Transcriptional regulator
MDKETIRGKALELFSKISFEKTSIADIAKACNMGKGTFYLYFESKDEIFASILEERIDDLDRKYHDYYRDPSVSIETKIRTFFECLVDEYFVIKDLLFGSFENMQGGTLKEVFFKFGKYYQRSVEQLHLVLSTESGSQEDAHLREKSSELMDVMLGRMLFYIMIHEWNDREGLKKIISPLSEKLYSALVA